MEQTRYPLRAEPGGGRLSGRMRTARHAPAKNATRSGRPSDGEGVTVTRCQDFQHVSRAYPPLFAPAQFEIKSRPIFDLGTHPSDVELTMAPMWVATMPLIVAAHAAHRGKAGVKMLSVDNGTRPCEQSGQNGDGAAVLRNPLPPFLGPFPPTQHLTGPWQPIQPWQKDNAKSLRSGSALPGA
jgi:hypothetical protein